ncbi:MAG: ribosome maturation factor RimP [Gemmatimonadaceae bacterium]|nr:ribosome maturation factor RimP [Gemmatimonadaceae bacterium]
MSRATIAADGNVGMPPTFFCFVKVARKNMSEAPQDIVVSELAPLGLELFELRTGGTKNRPVLDVRIERKDGEKITVDDCARASRAIEAKLDAGNAVGTRYVLEVSSPGVERPLRNAADWGKFVGRDAVVTTDSIEGAAGLSSKEVRIARVEGDPGAEIVIVEDASGAAHRVPLAAVRKARLAFNWKR